MKSGASVVDVAGGSTVREWFEFLFRCHSRVAHTALHQASECELLVCLLCVLGGIHPFPNFFIQLLGYEWLMLSDIPLAASSWILDQSAVEGVLENGVHIAER